MPPLPHQLVPDPSTDVNCGEMPSQKSGSPVGFDDVIVPFSRIGTAFVYILAVSEIFTLNVLSCLSGSGMLFASGTAAWETSRNSTFPVPIWLSSMRVFLPK